MNFIIEHPILFTLLGILILIAFKLTLFLIYKQVSKKECEEKGGEDDVAEGG